MDSWSTTAPLGVATSLTCVDVYTSCVLDADLGSSWQAVRNWGASPWLRGREELSFSLINLGGAATSQVGSTRVFRVGNSQVFEQLSALDDDEHTLRWKLLSHPQNISPFSRASFVNYVSSIGLQRITVSNSTFAVWKGQVLTEPQNVEHMYLTLQKWFLTGFENLQEYILGEPRKGVVAQHPQSFHKPSSPLEVPLQSVLHFPSQSSCGSQHSDPAYQKPRFVGSLAEVGGIPIAQQGAEYCPAGSRACGTPIATGNGLKEMECVEAAMATGTAAVRPPPSAFSSQGISVPRFRSRSKEPATSQHKEVPPQGLGLPSHSSKSSKMSVASAQAPGSNNRDVSTSSGSSQQADNQSSSWGTDREEQGDETNIVPAHGVDAKSNFSSLQRDGSQVSFPEMDDSGTNSWGSEKDGQNSNRVWSTHELAGWPDRRRLPPSAMEATQQTDQEFMEQLTQQLQDSCSKNEDKSERNSFEEAAARLEKRHRQLHRAPMTASNQSPFASPFNYVTMTPPFGPALGQQQQQSLHFGSGVERPSGKP